MPVIWESVLLLSASLLGGWLVLDQLWQQRQKNALKKAFYEILAEQDSKISLIQLALKAGVEANLARSYLEIQVKAFGAFLEVDREGNSFYRFPKLTLNEE